MGNWYRGSARGVRAPTGAPRQCQGMGNEQAEFWSNVAEQYDRVADLQIGGNTRSMVRVRVDRERKLGSLVEFGCGTGFYTEVLARRAGDTCH